MKNFTPQGQIAFPTSLTESQFQKLIQAGLIVDGRMGGLVAGRPYEAGGVTVIFKFGSDYVLGSRVEGGEFIINAESAAYHHGRLRLLKSGIPPSESEELSIPCVHLLITEAQPDDRLLWLEWGSTAVGKEQAARYVRELNQLNQEQNKFLKCDLLEAFCIKCVAGSDPLMGSN